MVLQTIIMVKNKINTTFQNNFVQPKLSRHKLILFGIMTALYYAVVI